MRLSDRLTGLTGGGSDGWDLFRKARAMIAAGTPVIELTIGEHDIRTDASILDAMHASARGGHTGYATVPGIDELRMAVAGRITDRTGVSTGAENVLITPGGQAGLFASHLAVCNPGDRALFIDPYYATYPGSIRGAGAIPVPVPTRAADGFQPRAVDIAASATDAASLLINSPNNPTGAIYSPATMEGIADVCRSSDLWLISDEVYDTQVWHGEHLSPRALPGMVERTIVIGSMSKSHAMTGARIGWLCGPTDVIDHLTNLATHTTYGVPGFVQDAAVFALAQGHRLEAQIAAPFLRRRNAALRLLDGQNIVHTVPPDGAMYAMLDIRATGLSGEAFADSLLEAEHVAVMPGESFGAAAAGHVRVALTVEDTLFEDAFGRLLNHAARLVGEKNLT